MLLIGKGLENGMGIRSNGVLFPLHGDMVPFFVDEQTCKAAADLP